MIWYFLAGMIGGAVGVILFIHGWIKRHAIPIRMTREEWEKFDKEQEERSDD